MSIRKQAVSGRLVVASALAAAVFAGMVLVGCVNDDPNDPNDPGKPGTGGSPLVNTAWFNSAPATLTYTITTPAQLAGLAELVNGGTSFVGRTIVLGNDIDLAVYGVLSADFNSGKGWIPIGTFTRDTDNKPFSGTLDGNGKTIKGLYTANSSQNNVGLFGFIDGATVKDLGVINANVTGKESVGAVAGRMSGGNVENCYTTATVSGTNGVGGMVGHVRGGGTVSNSYTTGKTSGSLGVGGLVGYADGGNVTQCYATGAVTGTDQVGGVVGGVNLGLGVGGTVLSCVGLNLNIQSGKNVGRVLGTLNAGNWAGSGKKGSAQDNEAFAGMTLNGLATVWDDSDINGEPVTAGMILIDPSFGGRFSAANGWTLVPGKLPGLLGEPVDLPAHLQ